MSLPIGSEWKRFEKTKNPATLAGAGFQFF